MFTILAAFFVLCVCCFYLLYYKYVRFRFKVDQIQGPPVRSILLGNLTYFMKPKKLSRRVYLKTFYRNFINLYNQYRHYGVFRLWMGPGHVMYILTDPDNIECLLSSQTYLNKGSEYKFMSPWLGNGLFLLDSDHWRSRRKLLTPAFHYKAFAGFLPIFCSHTVKLLRKLEDAFGTQQELLLDDIRPLLEDCMLDIIKESSLGVDGSDEEESNEQYRKSLKNAIIASINRVKNPLHWVGWIYALTEKGQKFYRYLKYMEAYADEIISKRINYFRNLGNADFKATKIIDILLKKHFESDQDSKLDFGSVRDEISTFIFGGHDTTATSSIFTVFLVGHHLEVQEKIWKELDEIFYGDNTREISLDDLKQMRYLEQCIKETLRLYPPGQIVGRHISEPLTLPDGQTLLAGNNCYVPIVHLHRDDRYFELPNEFIPERWSRPIGKNPYTFIPFSAGPRNCIGQRYGMLELKYVLASVFRRYEVTSITKLEDVLLCIGPMMAPMTKIAVKLKRRC